MTQETPKASPKRKPKPQSQVKQLVPKPPTQLPDNKYAPQKLIERPGLGNLKVIDADRPEYKP